MTPGVRLSAPRHVERTAPAPGIGYQAYIDGLRAISVVAILLCHAFPSAMPGGFAGVDVFFVISGFLISTIVIGQMDAGSFRLGPFYARRARRILPALTLVLAVSLLLGWILYLPDEFRELGKQAAGGAGFYSNFVQLGEAGYFDGLASRKPLLHLWSLAIEGQFYLLWPPLLMLFRRRRATMALIVAATAASFLLNVLVRTDSALDFYLPATRAWELLVGCALACRRPVSRSAMAQEVLASVGIISILAAFLLLRSQLSYPGYWALLPVIGAACVIEAGPGASINRILAGRWWVFVGIISYPLYLWHWPLLVSARILGYSGTGVTLLLLCGSFALSWATWRFVEAPVRSRPPGKAVATLAGILLCCGIGGLLVFASNGIAGRPQSALASALVNDIRWQPKTSPCAERSDAELKICAQTRPGPVDAVVVGDSHALTLMQGLVVADAARNWLALGEPSCPPVIGVLARRPDRPPCGPSMARVLHDLEAPNAPRLVVIAFFGYFAERSDFAADHLQGLNGPSQYRLEGRGTFPNLSPGKEAALYEGLRNFISPLIRAGKTVIFVIDVPELPFMPRDCIRRPFGAVTNCTLARSIVDQRQRGLRRIAGALHADFPTMQLFDPLPILCGAGDCSPIRANHSWYADSHHLSGWGSSQIARSLLAQINATH